MPLRIPLTAALRQKIYDLGQQVPRLSNRQIAKLLDVHETSVLKFRDVRPVDEKSAQPESIMESDIRRLLKRSPATAEEIADALDCGPSKVKATIAAMRKAGAMIIDLPDGKFDLGSAALLEPGKHEVSGSRDEWTHRFGVTTDNHLCNKHSRLDVLNAAYDHFERQGITTVYNCGNWIDGEARFNKTELVTAPGMDKQLDYLIDKWPHRKGIKTLFIAGDDHEGWYQQREGVEVGRYLELRAQDQGREDLKYLGYGEADIALKYGSGEAVMRVLHPGGGSAYAISYTDQKRTESYQGGEKPQVEIVGHYHKWNHGYPREVHTVQCGCTCDQTLFMRKKRIQAHVGFVEIKIKQDERGVITRFAAEWFPYFNRGYYESRF